MFGLIITNIEDYGHFMGTDYKIIEKTKFMKKLFIPILFFFGFNTSVLSECYTERCNPYSEYQNPYSEYQNPYSEYQNPYSEYQNPYSDKYIPSCKKTGAC